MRVRAPVLKLRRPFRPVSQVFFVFVFVFCIFRVDVCNACVRANAVVSVLATATTPLIAMRHFHEARANTTDCVRCTGSLKRGAVSEEYFVFEARGCGNRSAASAAWPSDRGVRVRTSACACCGSELDIRGVRMLA